MDLIDIPEWILKRFSLVTKGPGMYLVAVVCTMDCSIIGSRINIQCKAPKIYFLAVDMNCDWIYLYGEEKQTGEFITKDFFKDHFMILERLL